jgi:hypothetical protein
MTDEKYYYQVYLEVSKKGADEVFGFINVSHIRYEDFEEVFKEQIEKESFLFEDVAYEITKEVYDKNKEFLDKEIPFKFDFNLFDYWVSLSGDKLTKYQMDYYDHLPRRFDER